MIFDNAFTLLIGNEGKLSTDSRDPGNWTGGKVGKGVMKGSKYGISAASYPNIDIKNLTLQDAKDIYFKDYWIDGVPDEVAFDLFDTSVNSGKTKAIKLLQQTVGTEIDGILGEKTYKACKSIKNIKAKYNANRLLFMTDCTIWESQGKGWARRVAHNLLLD
jgi:lysozyme family protein